MKTWTLWSTVKRGCVFTCRHWIAEVLLIERGIKCWIAEDLATWAFHFEALKNQINWMFRVKTGAVPLSVSPKPTLFYCRVDAAHEIGTLRQTHYMFFIVCSILVQDMDRDSDRMLAATWFLSNFFDLQDVHSAVACSDDASFFLDLSLRLPLNDSYMWLQYWVPKEAKNAEFINKSQVHNFKDKILLRNCPQEYLCVESIWGCNLWSWRLWTTCFHLLHQMGRVQVLQA